MKQLYTDFQFYKITYNPYTSDILIYKINCNPLDFVFLSLAKFKLVVNIAPENKLATRVMGINWRTIIKEQCKVICLSGAQLRMM